MVSILSFTFGLEDTTVIKMTVYQNIQKQSVRVFVEGEISYCENPLVCPFLSRCHAPMDIFLPQMDEILANIH